MSKRFGLYPGTFDPMTKGHLDVIERGAGLVDHLIVAVAKNTRKGPLFTAAERVEMVRSEIEKLNVACTIEVKSFSNLLVHFAEQQKATVLIRGLRAVSDFEYEFQMAATNRKLMPQLETAFLMASENYQFIASRFVKEIALMGGDVTPFLSSDIAARVREKVGQVG